jgi:hypothetical protein
MRRNSTATVAPPRIVRLIPSIERPAGAIHCSPEPGSPSVLAQQPDIQLISATDVSSASAGNASSIVTDVAAICVFIVGLFNRSHRDDALFMPANDAG